CPAILHGDRDHLLGYHADEHPLALQLGGDDPSALARAAALAAELGYDELDLNCGCPSPRVRAGSFGVVLMADPERVAACVEAMRAAAPLPVTVKHRLGFDQLDRYEDVARFVERVAAAGADRLVVHARKAVLGGVSPGWNRRVPPLRPAWVHRLKAEHPAVRIELNGGIGSLREAFEHLDAGLDGVMVGRAAYDDPMIFADADAWLDARERGEPPPAVRSIGASERIAVLQSLVPFASAWVQAGGRLHHAVRPMLGLVHGMPGARRFREAVVVGARASGATAE
ncbi:MAG: tRNA dihydrouridine(20/20a) synthase DusA, partial [Myxococcales bacterium]|nr:tRNA dihydrouridine(20/20a) synthase DusA [Myxococcales bacterium]